jgi:7-keto-8-aminopelargonate synthetase-like enzyme
MLCCAVLSCLFWRIEKLNPNLTRANNPTRHFSSYSMCGTIAPIAQMVAVARKHNAITFLDEVHAVGLYGDTGAGVAERDKIMGEVDVISGTLAKA